jgi:hypothetical protein
MCVRERQTVRAHVSESERSGGGDHGMYTHTHTHTHTQKTQTRLVSRCRLSGLFVCCFCFAVGALGFWLVKHSVSV